MSIFHKCLYVLMIVLSANLISGCNAPENDNTESNIQKPSYNAQQTEFSESESVIELSEPEGKLSLKEALALTILNNPELQAYSLEVRASEAREIQSGIWESPELSIDVEDIGGSGELSGVDGAETTIQLSQVIDLGGKTGKRKQSYAYDTKLADYDYQLKKLEISTNMTKVFLELLFLQEKEQLSTRLIGISEEIIKSVKDRIAVGKDSELELLKAEISLENVRLQHDEIKKQVLILRKRLGSYWSSLNPMFTKAEGKLEQIFDIPEFSSVQSHLYKNPALLKRAVEIKKYEAEYKLAESYSIPDISVSGGLKHFNTDDEAAFVFGLSIPLNSRAKYVSQRKEASYNLNKVQKLEQMEIVNMESQLWQIYNELETVYDKVNTIRINVMPRADKLFNATKFSYEQGKVSYLELLDSQQRYFDVQDSYIDIMVEYHILKTELESLIGRGLETMSINETRGDDNE